MARRIVVGVDGSDTSRRALAWATRVARRRDAHLEIVKVWRYPASSYPILGLPIPWPPESEMHGTVAAGLDKFLDECGRDVDLQSVSHESIVVQGSPGATLCDIAEGADLLVVGSRGLGGFKGLILGSVGAHCANVVPTAVAVIPESFDPDAPAHDKVVVGVDGSANAAAAVRWADEWAPEKASLHVLSAWSYPVSYDLTLADIDVNRFEEACLQTAANAAKAIEHHEYTASCRHADARVALPQAAESADLLVVGARGHSGLGRMLLGSVASSIVHHLTVPTVVVPDAKE